MGEVRDQPGTPGSTRATPGGGQEMGGPTQNRSTPGMRQSGSVEEYGGTSPPPLVTPGGRTDDPELHSAAPARRAGNPVGDANTHYETSSTPYTDTNTHYETSSTPHTDTKTPGHDTNTYLQDTINPKKDTRAPVQDTTTYSDTYTTETVKTDTKTPYIEKSPTSSCVKGTSASHVKSQTMLKKTTSFRQTINQTAVQKLENKDRKLSPLIVDTKDSIRNREPDLSNEGFFLSIQSNRNGTMEHINQNSASFAQLCNCDLRHDPGSENIHRLDVHIERLNKDSHGQNITSSHIPSCPKWNNAGDVTFKPRDCGHFTAPDNPPGTSSQREIITTDIPQSMSTDSGIGSPIESKAGIDLNASLSRELPDAGWKQDTAPVGSLSTQDASSTGRDLAERVNVFQGPGQQTAPSRLSPNIDTSLGCFHCGSSQNQSLQTNEDRGGNETGKEMTIGGTDSVYQNSVNQSKLEPNIDANIDRFTGSRNTAAKANSLETCQHSFSPDVRTAREILAHKDDHTPQRLKEETVHECVPQVAASTRNLQTSEFTIEIHHHHHVHDDEDNQSLAAPSEESFGPQSASPILENCDQRTSRVSSLGHRSMQTSDYYVPPNRSNDGLTVDRILLLRHDDLPGKVLPRPFSVGANEALNNIEQMNSHLSPTILAPNRKVKGILKTSSAPSCLGQHREKTVTLLDAKGSPAHRTVGFARPSFFAGSQMRTTFSYNNVAFEGEMLNEQGRKQSLAEVVSHMMRQSCVLEMEEDNSHPYGRDNSLVELVTGKHRDNYHMDAGKMIVWLALAIMIVSLAGGIIFMSETYNTNHRGQGLVLPSRLDSTTSGKVP